MATTRLDNETLRAELQKTQDALEAALRECQDKDCKYSRLLTTLQCHKVDHSRVVESLVRERKKSEKKQEALDALKSKLDAVCEELVKEREKTEKKQEDNNQLATIIKTYERFQLKILRKFKRVQLAKKSLKKSQEALIAGIDALTDNFDPVTGRRLFDAAGTLQWLTLTGGMQDIKQEHRRQIRDWIRAADQDEDGDEEDEEAD